MNERYRHQIVIQTPTESQNAYGEVSESWATLVTIWASMRSVRAQEDFAAGSQSQVNTYEFETYYLSTITPKQRIKYGSRYFDIMGAIDVDNRGRKMVITAVENTRTI